MSLITTPFGFESSAADVVAGIDLTGKRAVVTGGASGIGVETARALAGAGAEVTIAVRDLKAGLHVAADVGPRVRVAPLELTDRASIDAFADAWDDGPLDILVNNAGVMAIQDRMLSPDGHELQFATNHLGHFALTLGLRDALAAAGNARVVNVSSSGHLRSPVIFDDVDFRFRPYDPWLAYGQSKTANVLFSVELTRRWADDGVTSNALMPGGIATNLQRHVGGADYVERRLRELRENAHSEIRFKTPEQGAATSVLLAASPQLEGVGGRYFDDCNEAPVLEQRGDGFHGVAPYALDPDNAERLWELSSELVAPGAVIANA
jgi:NAD(P)-dependent dehydrogenase (short-subunit alcohol dehydrogenase family)